MHIQKGQNEVFATTNAVDAKGLSAALNQMAKAHGNKLTFDPDCTLAEVGSAFAKFSMESMLNPNDNGMAVEHE